jgi:hypothetical protein
MQTLDYILKKYDINLDGPRPIEIRNTSRDDLPGLFHELGFTKGAEIGVWRGKYSLLFCREIPDLEMLCVDPWIPYVEYKDHVRQDKLADAYNTARKNLAPYNCTLIRKFSMEAAKEIPDESLDFVYIDANHSFCDVVNDLTEWSKKVRKGGIVSGHDYKVFDESLFIHVCEAVNGFVKANYIEPWFVLGRSRVRRGEKVDKVRSYMWVK